MDHIYNCPPMCQECHHLHYSNSPCIQERVNVPELALECLLKKEDQPIIVAAAYKHRIDGRVGVLNAANIGGIGMVHLFMEDDPQWSWKGNLENFHFYWKLEEPRRIVDSKEFWERLNYQRDEEDDDNW